ncbi:MAG TPA: TetR family transcriptional regulator C-terminal domain-containing protein, partial [Solirubrobacteraceae bacterium]|nr:TetR family transcriptional regulator C-terminal domain-containing protein [Solirubrobacteraceae bacterium]
ETVGISQAGILHHFENKDALLIAVLRHRDDLARGFYSLPLGITTLISTLRVVEFNVAHPGAVELYCVLSAEATARNHPAHEYFVRRYAFLESVIGGALGQMQAAGQLRDGVEPMAAARSALALLDGLQLQWLLNRDSVDMVAAAETYFRQLATEDAWEAAIAAERDQHQSTSVVAK